MNPRNRATAERMVANGILAGAIMFVVGLYLLGRIGVSQSGGRIAFALMGVGAALALTSFGIGLVFAFRESLGERARKEEVWIERKYGLDPYSREFDDYPTPDLDGMKPMITFRLLDGKQFMIETSPEIYEDIVAGARGTATIRGRLMTRFERTE